MPLCKTFRIVFCHNVKPFILFFLMLLEFKGCVCYIFASLFCMSKREHL